MWLLGLALGEVTADKTTRGEGEWVPPLQMRCRANYERYYFRQHGCADDIDIGDAVCGKATIGRNEWRLLPSKGTKYFGGKIFSPYFQNLTPKKG